MCIHDTERRRRRGMEKRELGELTLEDQQSFFRYCSQQASLKNVKPQAESEGEEKLFFEYCSQQAASSPENKSPVKRMKAKRRKSEEIRPPVRVKKPRSSTPIPKRRPSPPKMVKTMSLRDAQRMECEAVGYGPDTPRWQRLLAKFDAVLDEQLRRREAERRKSLAAREKEGSMASPKTPRAMSGPTSPRPIRRRLQRSNSLGSTNDLHREFHLELQRKLLQRQKLQQQVWLSPRKANTKQRPFIGTPRQRRSARYSFPPTRTSGYNLSAISRFL